MSGTAYGLAIWGLSYQGWVPALGIMSPPERSPPGRSGTMIAAHLVYGLVLAILVE